MGRIISVRKSQVDVGGYSSWMRRGLPTTNTPVKPGFVCLYSRARENNPSTAINDMINIDMIIDQAI